MISHQESRREYHSLRLFDVPDFKINEAFVTSCFSPVVWTILKMDKATYWEGPRKMDRVRF